MYFLLFNFTNFWWVLQRKDNLDDVPIDKRRRIGSGRMVGPANSGRTRQAFSALNVGQDLGSVGNPAGNGSSDCSAIEFTKEDVEALLNEKIKGKTKFDFKVGGFFLIFDSVVRCFFFDFCLILQGKCELMTEYTKKLRLCIKWFQEIEESCLLEQGKLQKMLESAEIKCTDIGNFYTLLFLWS